MTCAQTPKVSGLGLAASYVQKWTLFSNRGLWKFLWSGWKLEIGGKEIASRFPWCPVNRECSWKKIQIEKKSLVFHRSGIIHESLIIDQKKSSFLHPFISVHDCFYWFTYTSQGVWQLDHKIFVFSYGTGIKVVQSV